MLTAKLTSDHQCLSPQRSASVDALPYGTLWIILHHRKDKSELLIEYENVNLADTYKDVMGCAYVFIYAVISLQAEYLPKCSIFRGFCEQFVRYISEYRCFEEGE